MLIKLNGGTSEVQGEVIQLSTKGARVLTLYGGTEYLSWFTTSFSNSIPHRPKDVMDHRDSNSKLRYLEDD